MVEFSDGPQKSNASTGKPYFTLVDGCIVSEGNRYPAPLAVSKAGAGAAEHKALRIYHERLDALLVARNAIKVEWRMRPVVEWLRKAGNPWPDIPSKGPFYDRCEKTDKPDFVRVYSRLAIVDPTDG